MKYQYICTDETNPYRNLATEQELMQYAESGTAILFLWQNEKSIILGRNQDARGECKVEEFLRSGGRIARRRSGGGAVYHDLGNLNFSIISTEREKEECRYQELLSLVLKKFGLDVHYNGRNDLLLDGRKFSGNAVFQDGQAVCQHGTLLLSTDIQNMEYFLTPDPEKLSRNHVKSIPARVINLSSVNGEINKENIIRAFLEVTEAVPLKATPDSARIKELADFYQSDAWIYNS